ncbi:flagellar biosynthetic protein FliO [Hoeflea ulvae]|uniref:Flagellar biosynthetic protein FliO n=1 Tax=Hoeflea ulvae TaxID=2983764 RepID=A0ABT3YHP5_9HYPH|nr:flagellar biosynthetic protein FliO [Hoeflea ulvae]MCY0095425.1 flagellar biosynthetic protein FliO [Hoeflea ulvae]
MPDNILGGQGATLLIAVIVVAVALLALVGVFWLIRNRAASTFIRGGKNRQPRLAVLDAAAVDTRRRLVLIRRDDVEHLVMIGGPTDIVIESRIMRPDSVAGAQPHQPARPEPSPQSEAAPRPAEFVQRTPASRVQPAPRPAPERPAASAAPDPAPSRTAAPRPAVLPAAQTRWTEPVPSPQAPGRPAPAAAPAAAATVAAGAAGNLRTEASKALESARTRVFEEPSFDEATFDELTRGLDSEPLPTFTPRTPVETPEHVYEPAPQRQTAQASSAAGTAQHDFEAMLAEEMAAALPGDPEDDSQTDPPLAADRTEDDELPEVQPETRRSRISLEEEMEQLLGDLSRKR